MNVNEIVTRLQEIDLSMLLFQNGENSRVLSINEMIVLAVLAAAGVLICLLGLKIVRFWAAVLGLLAGFAGGFSVAGVFGVEPMVSLIIGLAAGVILAVLGAVLYRVGVFLTVFLTVGAFCISILNPQDWIFLGSVLALPGCSNLVDLACGRRYDYRNVAVRRAPVWKRSGSSRSGGGNSGYHPDRCYRGCMCIGNYSPAAF